MLIKCVSVAVDTTESQSNTNHSLRFNAMNYLYTSMGIHATCPQTLLFILPSSICPRLNAFISADEDILKMLNSQFIVFSKRLGQLILYSSSSSYSVMFRKSRLKSESTMSRWTPKSSSIFSFEFDFVDFIFPSSSSSVPIFLLLHSTKQSDRLSRAFKTHFARRCTATRHSTTKIYRKWNCKNEWKRE